MKLLDVRGVSDATHRHPETVRAALNSGELHGYQTRRKSPWVVEEDCALAWRLGQKCEHQVEVAA